MKLLLKLGLILLAAGLLPYFYSLRWRLGMLGDPPPYPWPESLPVSDQLWQSLLTASALTLFPCCRAASTGTGNLARVSLATIFCLAMTGFLFQL